MADGMKVAALTASEKFSVNVLLVKSNPKLINLGLVSSGMKLVTLMLLLLVSMKFSFMSLTNDD